MTASLVVQTSFLGDVVLTTPLIAALAQRGPVDVLATPAGAALLANNPHIRRVIAYDKRGRDAGIAGLVRTTRTIRQLGADSRGTTAYLAQGSLRSAALVIAAGIRARVGFSSSAGRAMYSRRVLYRDDWHHARRLLSLSDEEAAARIHDPDLRPRLYPASADVRAVDELLAGHVGSLVALAPGSAWGTKRWPHFAELAALLAPAAEIAVIGDDSDRAVADDIVCSVRDRGGRVFDGTGRLSLLASAELVGRATALVANDSLPLHLGSAMGTRTIALFGPTVPEFGFGPLASGSNVLGRSALACRPCDRHGPARCPLTHWKCMRELTPAIVRESLLETLELTGIR